MGASEEDEKAANELLDFKNQQSEGKALQKNPNKDQIEQPSQKEKTIAENEESSSSADSEL